VISIYPYQTQEVRDLAWACFSPTLLHVQQLADDGHNVADCGLTLTPERQAWLQALDHNADALLEHLATQPITRLGIYFERLWHFFLEQDPGLDLIAHNLPVHHQGRTLGEFDCLYFCRQRQRHFHLELAVKYYLGRRQSTTTEPASHWHEWLGPNTHDRLDRKIEHLLQRQCRLSEHPVAREQLQALGVPEPAREVTLKGYLFHSIADPLPPPYGFNRDCHLNGYLGITGLSAYLEQLDPLSTEGYMILPRANWLAAASVAPDLALSREHVIAQLSDHFREQKRPQLVAVVAPSGREVQRFFITASDWPE